MAAVAHRGPFASVATAAIPADTSSTAIGARKKARRPSSGYRPSAAAAMAPTIGAASVSATGRERRHTAHPPTTASAKYA